MARVGDLHNFTPNIWSCVSVSMLGGRRRHGAVPGGGSVGCGDGRQPLLIAC